MSEFVPTSPGGGPRVPTLFLIQIQLCQPHLLKWDHRTWLPVEDLYMLVATGAPITPEKDVYLTCIFLWINF